MNKNKSRQRKGLTLPELLVVVAILGIVLSIAIPRISAYVNSANMSEAKFNHQTIVYSMKAWALDNKQKNEIPGSFSVENTQGKTVIDYIKQYNRDFYIDNIQPKESTITASNPLKSVKVDSKNTTYTLSQGTLVTKLESGTSIIGELNYDPLNGVIPKSDYKDFVEGY